MLISTWDCNKSWNTSLNLFPLRYLLVSDSNVKQCMYILHTKNISINISFSFDPTKRKLKLSLSLNEENVEDKLLLSNVHEYRNYNASKLIIAITHWSWQTQLTYCLNYKQTYFKVLITSIFLQKVYTSLFCIQYKEFITILIALIKSKKNASMLGFTIYKKHYVLSLSILWYSVLIKLMSLDSNKWQAFPNILNVACRGIISAKEYAEWKSNNPHASTDLLHKTALTYAWHTIPEICG